MPLTKQQAYDKVYDWFVTQGKPISRDPRTGFGLLRSVGPGGEVAKCALGVLIEDKDYLPKMEILDEDGVMYVPYVLEGVEGQSRIDLGDFIQTLATIHDDYSVKKNPSFREYMKENLEALTL